MNEEEGGESATNVEVVTPHQIQGSVEGWNLKMTESGEVYFITEEGEAGEIRVSPNSIPADGSVQYLAVNDSSVDLNNASGNENIVIYSSAVDHSVDMTKNGVTGQIVLNKYQETFHNEDSVAGISSVLPENTLDGEDQLAKTNATQLSKNAQQISYTSPEEALYTVSSDRLSETSTVKSTTKPYASEDIVLHPDSSCGVTEDSVPAQVNTLHLPETILKTTEKGGQYFGTKYLVLQQPDGSQQQLLLLEEREVDQTYNDGNVSITGSEHSKNDLDFLTTEHVTSSMAPDAASSPTRAVSSFKSDSKTNRFLKLDPSQLQIKRSDIIKSSSLKKEEILKMFMGSKTNRKKKSVSSKLPTKPNMTEPVVIKEVLERLTSLEKEVKQINANYQHMNTQYIQMNKQLQNLTKLIKEETNKPKMTTPSSSSIGQFNNRVTGKPTIVSLRPSVGSQPQSCSSMTPYSQAPPFSFDDDSRTSDDYSESELWEEDENRLEGDNIHCLEDSTRGGRLVAWSPQMTKLLLSLRQKHDGLFNEDFVQGERLTKRKAWNIIAKIITKVSSVYVTGDQCETKWKRETNKKKPLVQDGSKSEIPSPSVKSAGNNHTNISSSLNVAGLKSARKQLNPTKLSIPFSSKSASGCSVMSNGNTEASIVISEESTQSSQDKAEEIQKDTIKDKSVDKAETPAESSDRKRPRKEEDSYIQTIKKMHSDRMQILEKLVQVFSEDT
ncbi:uncharacterized protein LOC106462853 [Limulus polyphemus]|uniref:Uncharacterized protein LOC106462853 n=1 Tax=Limulus polyphemus TaxID=6850 RepID=A0ABM1BAS8_LIMPO|nr:uncharacterized protein LOC106462853 [Limulus polyphemus]XP_022245953.1 uncharacterized protein LOC106462853 [Limulus polyphemus]XP_022245954.1 uncharacterized protein LOC106462853 [Limulus polyphemus]XP_022245955.1 uncharacterized protein LOC106462853 [Limulus polyphemus]